MGLLHQGVDAQIVRIVLRELPDADETERGVPERGQCAGRLDQLQVPLVVADTTDEKNRERSTDRRLRLEAWRNGSQVIDVDEHRQYADIRVSQAPKLARGELESAAAAETLPERLQLLAANDCVTMIERIGRKEHRRSDGVIQENLAIGETEDLVQAIVAH